MSVWYLCFPPEDFRNSKHYLRTVEDDRRDTAEARTCLWHYTNAEALYKILSNRTIRFSRVDQVNDLSEVEPLKLGQIYLGTYIACYTHNMNESIPLWSMYTRKGNGVRIEFAFKENKIQNSFTGIVNKNNENLQFDRFSTFIHDVEYSKEIHILPVIHREDDIYVDVQAIAFEKNDIWSYEEETRIMMFTGAHSNEEMPPYIDFLLNYEKLEHIKIVFDPWMSEEIKQSIKLTTRYYINEYASILEFDNSVLEGKIR